MVTILFSKNKVANRSENWLEYLVSMCIITLKFCFLFYSSFNKFVIRKLQIKQVPFSLIKRKKLFSLMLFRNYFTILNIHSHVSLFIHSYLYIDESNLNLIMLSKSYKIFTAFLNYLVHIFHCLKRFHKLFFSRFYSRWSHFFYLYLKAIYTRVQVLLK